MTTYARVEDPGEAGTLELELRSVNHRYCDVSVRMPRWLAPVEEQIKKAIQGRLLRGRVDLFIQWGGAAARNYVFEPDVALVSAYLEAVKRLGSETGLDHRMDMASLLGLVKDAIVAREERKDDQWLWERIRGPLQRLLDQAVEMSRQEGDVLAKDLGAHLERLEVLVGEVGSRSAKRKEEGVTALRARLEDAVGDIGLDPQRLAQEVVLMADKLDVNEEVVRAKSHIAQFRKLLVEEGPVGRRMDFLLQECFREVNTMASKSADAPISQMVVEMKGELEKMREQVQNVV